MKNGLTIEERLLTNKIYRAIMSLFWPYQRMELLVERKTLLEFCTIAIVLYAGADAIMCMVAEASTIRLLISLLVCSLTPVFAKIYWYILVYAYDVVVPPIESKITVGDETDIVTFVDDFRILDYTTPTKLLLAAGLIVLLHSPNPVLAQIMSIGKIGFIGVCGLGIVDFLLVAFSDYRTSRDEIEEEFDDPNNRFQLDWSKFEERQSNDDGDVKITVAADLEQSDEANQKMFMDALTAARKIVAQRSAK